jgi:isoquinoline 1-oxidoreductase subunit alpha
VIGKVDLAKIAGVDAARFEIFQRFRSERNMSASLGSITVNGLPRRPVSAGDTPLLWYLRDELGLTGTRFGCGAGLCGCCTVHVDGKAVRSCLERIDGLGGKQVTTIEQLSSNGLHPLQEAWIALQVPQCGYCQSGQIMQAAALLLENPDPSDADIDAAMSGNICRCGTYPRIRAAIKRVAKMQTKSSADRAPDSLE